MENKKWKRFGSCLMALAMVLSGTALPASAATPGKDGSAEMNEAYAAHESLMPIGPSFSVATLLEWTPESDPDARYSRASIPMANREGGFVVNPKANPEAKLMLCSLANSSHDTTSSQGTENFMSWSFNYWQYTDSFVYWSGSEEGLICCPTGEFTDAAHTNGVPVVATLGFPWGSGSGYAEEVDAFCQKAEDGSFPVADKLLEVMDYYGFDGYFFNQESFGCSAEIASRLDEMIRYMRAKCPDILISWYDSMLPSGGVSYQNAVNSSNQRWMERSDDGSVGINEFFMNYNWYTGQISTTVSTMNSINRSPFDAYAGLDVQQNGMNTPFRDELLVDEDGKLKLSIALYCPNSTLGNSANGAQFHEVEQDFYVNSASDPRVEVANVSSSTWLGMSRFFADKTPILSTPFVTSFNSGHGVGYYVNGELSRDNEWSYQSVQDVMPTWTWIIDSDGSKLDGGYDFTDAYNGGTSIQFYGDLDANKANDIMLYSTDVAVTDGMTLSLTAKNDDGKARLVAYYGDDSTASYEECETVAYDLTASKADTWTTTVVDISDHVGKTLYAIGLKVESDTAVSDYRINLGQLAILDQDRAALSGPTSVALDEILYHNAYIEPFTHTQTPALASRKRLLMRVLLFGKVSYYTMDTGSRIKLVREHRGLTQQKLGEMLGYGKSSANRIAQYEMGYRSPKANRLKEIAKAMNIREEIFLMPDETPIDLLRILIWYDWEHEGVLQLATSRTANTPPGKTVSPIIYSEQLPLNRLLLDWADQKHSLSVRKITRADYLEWMLQWPPRLP